MKLLAMLVLSMLARDRAEQNARLTLHANGLWPTRVGCTVATDGWACVADFGAHYAILRCAGDRPEPCTWVHKGAR